MKRMILVLATLAGLIAAAPAAAATTQVAITRAGFVPEQVTIAVGDTVTWTNQDTQTHQVVSQSAPETFASPVLQPNQTYSHTYRNSGRFTVTDPLNRNRRMTVIVRAAPASVTIAASRTIVVYGGSVTLSGRISSGQSGQGVQVFAQELGQTSFTKVADVSTTTNGAWSYVARPQVQTTYQVRWRGSTSGSVTIRVRPRVGLGIVSLARGVFRARVTARTSFAGKLVYFQRRNSLGRWVTLKRVRLGSTSAATFRARLPRGVSRIRVYVPQSQVGAGYIPGVSSTRLVRRG